MLKFVSAYLALGYMGFATIVVMGLLQVLAARASVRAFALADYRRPGWRALGPVLIALAYIGFFGTWRELITPGPAGAELVVLFAGAVLLALAITLSLASVLRPYHQPHPPEVWRQSPRTAGHGLWQALENQPRLVASHAEPARDSALESPAPEVPNLQKAASGVLLVSDPIEPQSTTDLAQALAARGCEIRTLAWSAIAQHPSEALALAGEALATLAGGRLAIIGVGLGGDLALALAAVTPPALAIALAPLLDEGNARPRLALLYEMTYSEALTWGLHGRRRRLLQSLQPLAALSKVADRAQVLLAGDDALVPSRWAAEQLTRAGVAFRIIPGEQHVTLAQNPAVQAFVGEWLDQAVLTVGADMDRAVRP